MDIERESLYGDIFYISFVNFKNCCETAIVFLKNKEEVYLILNGDWRNEYKKIINNGLASCIEFFNENVDFRSSYSD